MQINIRMFAHTPSYIHSHTFLELHMIGVWRLTLERPWMLFWHPPVSTTYNIVHIFPLHTIWVGSGTLLTSTALCAKHLGLSSVKEQATDIHTNVETLFNVLRTTYYIRSLQGRQNNTMQTVHKTHSVTHNHSMVFDMITTQLNKVQTIQNTAYRIITGCTQTTLILHIHVGVKVLPFLSLKDYLEMRGTQF